MARRRRPSLALKAPLYPREGSLLRCAPVAHPGLHICLSLWTCAIARVFYAALRLPRCCGCPPWATLLTFPWDMRYRAGVRSRLISLRFTLSGLPSAVFLTAFDYLALRAAFGRLPSQPPLACVHSPLRASAPPREICSCRLKLNN